MSLSILSRFFGGTAIRGGLRTKLLLSLMSGVFMLVNGVAIRGAEEPTAAEVEAEATYMLRYQFDPEEVVRWKVVHRGSTETKIQGNTQTSESRSESIKAWHVKEVDTAGVITLVHQVDRVDMWQKISDRPEVRYNSKLDTVAPREYEQVAKTIGVPLTTVKFQPDGQILERDSKHAATNLGLGEIVMLLPPKPVKLGGTWYEPAEVRLRLSDGSTQKVKIHKHYTLESVAAGVATIGVTTQVLTPVNDPRLEAQLVQQLVKGTIQFDLERGRILRQQMNWDETIVSFNGADSMMKYRARFTEELLGPDAEVSTTLPTVRAQRTDKPALRR
jgi:hypothetical protein